MKAMLSLCFILLTYSLHAQSSEIDALIKKRVLCNQEQSLIDLAKDVLSINPENPAARGAFLQAHEEKEACVKKASLKVGKTCFETVASLIGPHACNQEAQALEKAKTDYQMESNDFTRKRLYSVMDAFAECASKAYSVCD